MTSNDEASPQHAQDDQQDDFFNVVGPPLRIITLAPGVPFPTVTFHAGNPTPIFECDGQFPGDTVGHTWMRVPSEGTSGKYEALTTPPRPLHTGSRHA